jgi:hypothetical protein
LIGLLEVDNQVDVIGHDDITEYGGVVFFVQEVDAVANDLPAGFGGQQMIPMVTSSGDEKTLLVWEIGASSKGHVGGFGLGAVCVRWEDLAALEIPMICGCNPWLCA